MDFSLLLPPLPARSGEEAVFFLEEANLQEWGTSPGGSTPGRFSDTNQPAALLTFNKDEDDQDFADSEDEDDSSKKAKRVSKAKKPNLKDDGEEHDGTDAERTKKRREQIAAASRASRARRKRELDDLRDENKRLREERTQFLGKISELQLKVDHMRERGSTDMKVENELLRVQLEEHKRFVSCFKQLCEGAPTSLQSKHQLYKQGSENAHAHVLGLISQSQHDEWLEATIPAELEIPYSNFSMFYKFKRDADSESQKQRLNIRVDALLPNVDCQHVADFFWKSYGCSAMQEKLYRVKGVEVTSLSEESMPDPDTKTLYFREKKQGGGRRDQDWVMISNRRRQEIPGSTLALPRAKSVCGTINALVLALSTTQHAVTSEFDTATRINALFVQGCVTWNLGSDCRLCVVFSLPEELHISGVENFEDVVNAKGVLSGKFAQVLLSFKQMVCGL